ncbi:MAG: hypothetical protein K8823_1069 [Cenarchaeum symbiont of Oopsacas minuta]|nr:hypothetical protein [Cenarchaeum symbiont of Oopsacas minuta]
MEFTINFFGHENIRSLHSNTIEITCERDLTISGDCILGVRAECGCHGLPNELKTALRRSDSIVRIILSAGGEDFTVNAQGSSDLILEHATDIVIRKSSFICPRTLAIKSDVASDSLPRSMLFALQNPSCAGTMNIRID